MMNRDIEDSLIPYQKQLEPGALSIETSDLASVLDRIHQMGVDKSLEENRRLGITAKEALRKVYPEAFAERYPDEVVENPAKKPSIVAESRPDYGSDGVDGADRMEDGNCESLRDGSD